MWCKSFSKTGMRRSIPLLGAFCLLSIFPIINVGLHFWLSTRGSLYFGAQSFHVAAATDTSLQSKTLEAGQNHERYESRIPSLSCREHGGPEDASFMVYWEEIADDRRYVSPLQSKERTQYITFEPDLAGFNNVRLGMETVLAMAYATGRTLVLPPHRKMRMPNSRKRTQKDTFGFEDFFPLDDLRHNVAGLDIITMSEFIEREKGTFVDAQEQRSDPPPPPEGQSSWDTIYDREDEHPLINWLRSVAIEITWDPDECVALLPSSPGSVDHLQSAWKTALEDEADFMVYVGKPIAINSTTVDRLKEMRANRKHACVYDESLQTARHIHFPRDRAREIRQLVHWYAFLFFEDWQQDLHMKRFVRDQVRYVDEVQCAAARVVKAVQDRAVRKYRSDAAFDAIHIRRGDFAKYFPPIFVGMDVIYNQTSKVVPDGATLYIATDERNLTVFAELGEKYDITFLDDYLDQIEGVNTHLYGMIDQLVVSQSRTFFGCWFSTLSAFVNRVRGYHATQRKGPGYEHGLVESYYYAPADRFDHMRAYWPVKKSFYVREFPTGWRLIDTGMHEFHQRYIHESTSAV